MRPSTGHGYPPPRTENRKKQHQKGAKMSTVISLLINGLYVIATIVGVYFLIALILIFTEWPKELPASKGLDFPSGGSETNIAPHEETTYTTRNDDELPVRIFLGSDDLPLIIVVHGSGWHGGAYLELASELAAPGHTVLVPDMRGHGVSPERRGDVDYVGQFEDDLADLIQRYQVAEQEVILVGHSSGGGLVVRFAGGPNGLLMDRAVVIAPFLKHDAPTTRAQSGGWAHPLNRRYIGLIMLNVAGLEVLNNLTVIQFNFPDQVLQSPTGETATGAYSYRLNTSFAPRNSYQEDVALLPKFLLVVGADDEAFVAENFEPLLKPMTSNGTYAIVPDQSHLGILTSNEAFDTIREFVAMSR
ncbi:MAG: pimeloyl-ACP methyl ester carboxylesterase [Candidatus Azotimanducaceae bacterium]|jgi:pimeloyl-ACP methyl ester carboxylesterase